MNKYYRIFKELVRTYPSYAGAIITDFMLPFFDKRYSLKECLEDFAGQPGVDKQHVLNLLERVK